MNCELFFPEEMKIHEDTKYSIKKFKSLYFRKGDSTIRIYLNKYQLKELAVILNEKVRE